MMIDVSLPATITCVTCQGTGAGPLSSVCGSCDGAGKVEVVITFEQASVGALTLAIDQLAAQRRAAAAVPTTYSVAAPTFPPVQPASLPAPVLPDPIPDLPNDLPDHADPYGSESSVTHADHTDYAASTPTTAQPDSSDPRPADVAAPGA